MLNSIQNVSAKIKNIRKEILYVTVFGFIYLLWNYKAFFMPNGFLSSPNHLDPSWIVGLNWASFLGLKWSGDNLVFTYGPLHYLSGRLLPQFYPSDVVISINVGLNLFFMACFMYIYSLFAPLHFERIRKWAVIVVIAMLLFQEPSISLSPFFVAFMFLPIIFDAKIKAFSRYLRYGIITLLLAIIPFVKFSHIYESLLLIIVMIGFSIYSRRYLDAVIIGIAFSVFTILTWVLTTGENPLSFFFYLTSRLSISSGYTEAMMMDFDRENSFPIFILALLFLATVGTVQTYLLLTRQWRWAAAWLLCLITLLFAFKSSFVRAATGHAHTFLGHVFLAVLYYFYLLKVMNPGELPSLWSQPAAQALAPVFILLSLSTFYFLGGRFVPKNQVLTVLQAGDTYSQEMDQELLKKVYPLEPEFLGQIDPQKATDIIPWDIALLYGYNLHWTPRPVIQSYASYTSKLDHLDAVFFKQPDSPDQVIFSLFSIDSRYTPFDTPHTFRTLLDHYEFAIRTADGRYSLLKKRGKTISRDLVSIRQKEYNINEAILVPKARDGHVFMAIEIKPTLIGRFLNIAYKPTVINVEMELDTGEKQKYRLIRDTAQNGLFVSKHIKNLDDLSSVFNETYGQDIVSIRFIGDPWLYNSLVSVHFYKVLFD